MDVALDPAGTSFYYHASTLGDDGGVYRIDVATGQRTRLVQRPPDADRERNLLEMSLTGRTLASSYCDQDDCSVDVFSLPAGKLRQISSFPLTAAGDRYLLGVAAGQTSWTLYDLETGKTRNPASRILHHGEGYAVGENEFLISGWDDDEYFIVLADAATGSERLVLRRPHDTQQLLMRGIAAREWALLGPTSIEVVMEEGGGAYDLLETATGAVFADVAAVRIRAFEVPPDTATALPAAPSPGPDLLLFAAAGLAGALLPRRRLGGGPAPSCRPFDWHDMTAAGRSTSRIPRRCGSEPRDSASSDPR